MHLPHKTCEMAITPCGNLLSRIPKFAVPIVTANWNTKSPTCFGNHNIFWPHELANCRPQPLMSDFRWRRRVHMKQILVGWNDMVSFQGMAHFGGIDFAQKFLKYWQLSVGQRKFGSTIFHSNSRVNGISHLPVRGMDQAPEPESKWNGTRSF